jgi:hypothetical protein
MTDQRSFFALLTDAREAVTVIGALLTGVSSVVVAFNDLWLSYANAPLALLGVSTALLIASFVLIATAQKPAESTIVGVSANGRTVPKYSKRLRVGALACIPIVVILAFAIWFVALRVTPEQRAAIKPIEAAGDMHYELGNLESALQDYHDALEIWPRNPQLRDKIARVQERLKEIQDD